MTKYTTMTSDGTSGTRDDPGVHVVLWKLLEHEAHHAELARMRGAIVIGDDLDPPPVPDDGDDVPVVRVSLREHPTYKELTEFFKGRTFALHGGQTPHGQKCIVYVDDAGRTEGQFFNALGSALTGHLLCGHAWICAEAALHERDEA